MKKEPDAREHLVRINNRLMYTRKKLMVTRKLLAKAIEERDNIKRNAQTEIKHLSKELEAMHHCAVMWQEAFAKATK